MAVAQINLVAAGSDAIAGADEQIPTAARSNDGEAADNAPAVDEAAMTAKALNGVALFQIEISSAENTADTPIGPRQRSRQFARRGWSFLIRHGKDLNVQQWPGWDGRHRRGPGRRWRHAQN